MPETSVMVNRAPVLALWATVVAERLGHDHGAALSLGRAVTGLAAQSKGQRLGIYSKRPESGRKAPAARTVPLLGREVPVAETPDGIRAVAGGRPVTPESVERYLESKFGEHLAAVRRAMVELAGSLEPGVLAGKAYALYVRFRPEIPPGVRGWGAKGRLDITRLRHLADDEASHG